MAYSDAFGWRERFGDEPLDPRSDSSGQDRFELAPCSRAGGLVSLASEGAAVEPPLSVGTSGAAVDPPPPICRSSTGTPGVASDPPTATSPEDGPMVWPAFIGLMDSLPYAWNGKGPCVDKWVLVSVSSLSRTSHSTSATTSSNSSSVSPCLAPVLATSIASSS